MPKAVIFDLNGVFVKSPKLSERFNEHFGVPAAEFLAALKEVMDKVRMPDAGDSFAYWQPYLEKWGVNLTREAFFDFWFSAEREVPEMTALARELKGNGMKLFILSNNFAERTAFYQKQFPFLGELFEKVYYSWQTGFRKDNEAAYRNLLAENGLAPEECMFFDDSAGNVELAKRLGITAYVFENPSRTRALLEP